MPLLNRQPNFHHHGQAVPDDPSASDDFYELLLDAHQGLSEAHSQLFNAKLVLLLANHVGDVQTLQEALQHARAGLGD